MKGTGPTNQITRDLVLRLKKTKKPIWKAVAMSLEKPSRNRPEVNISRLNRHSEKGDSLVVPGKVLGSGTIDFPVDVAALSFSEEAKRKIAKAGGKAHRIEDIIEKPPKGLRLFK